jgi:hypothetical protein
MPMPAQTLLEEKCMRLNCLSVHGSWPRSTMNPERWKRIEQLYHATLEREANVRAAFLQQACAGDRRNRPSRVRARPRREQRRPRALAFPGRLVRTARCEQTTHYRLGTIQRDRSGDYEFSRTKWIRSQNPAYQSGRCRQRVVPELRSNKAPGRSAIAMGNRASHTDVL